MSKTEKLIEQLSEELKPFTPVRPSFGLAVRWFLLAVTSTVLATLWIAPFRANFLNQLSDSPRFLAQSGLGALLVFVASWNVFSLGIPGSKSKRIGALTLSVLLLLVGLFVYSFIEPATTVSMIGKRPFCFYEGLVHGSLLTLSLLILLRRRAPFSRVGVAILSAIAAVAITSTVMNLACMYSPEHVLTHHIAPVAPLSVLALLLSAALIRKI